MVSSILTLSTVVPFVFIGKPFTYGKQLKLNLPRAEPALVHSKTRSSVAIMNRREHLKLMLPELIVRRTVGFHLDCGCSLVRFMDGHSVSHSNVSQIRDGVITWVFLVCSNRNKGQYRPLLVVNYAQVSASMRGRRRAVAQSVGTRG